MRFFLLLGLMLSWLLAGNAALAQSGSLAPAMTGQGGAQAAAKAQELSGSNYVIRPLDVVEFRVFQEPTMQQQLRIAQDGSITLPLIGSVRVGGMTAESAQQLIAELYDKDYLVDPQVSLVVLSYTERRIFVHGQVMSQGPVVIPPETELTLAQAINAAGGLTRLARRNPIRVKRVGKDDVIEVNFNDVLTDPKTKDIPLQDGDIVFVDERIF